MKKLFAAILLSSLLFTACSFFRQQPPAYGPPKRPKPAPVIESTTENSSTAEEPASDKTTITEITSATPAEPQYLAYSEDLYDSLLGKEPFALFFHASWCEVCRRVEGNIEADLASFPKGTKILKVNFDTETELKKTYGITVRMATRR